MSLSVEIQGVSLKIPFLERWDEFTPMTWEFLLRNYPLYCREVRAKNGTPHNTREYMMVLAKELAKKGGARSGDALLQEYLAHYGTFHMADFIARNSNV